MLISTALLLDSILRNSVCSMYSGKIAVPPRGGGLRCNNNNNNNNVENVVTQSRTGLQIYEGRDDQLNRPGPMA
jgi:hypothetical protein